MMPVIVIVVLFFIFGITVGVIAVVALSARRRYRWHWQPDWTDPASQDRAPDRDDSPVTDDDPWWKTRDGD
jgi:hypothetical protein